jgi:nucleotide-binding universal stress UspA family protein
MTNDQQSSAGSVLLCLDGSPAAAAGLPYAVALSRASDADILLLVVLEASPGSHPRAVDALGTEVARQAAVEYLKTVKAELEQRALAVRTRLIEGSAAPKIIHVADKEEVRVIVMATHGSNEATQFRLGGTAEKVAQHARHSIFLARSSGQSAVAVDCALQRILVLLDGSQAAEAALVPAETLAKEQGAEIILGHVASRPALPTCEPLMHSDQDLLDRLEVRAKALASSTLRGLEQTLRREGLQARHIVTNNQDTRQGALDMAREVRADLIVLASHGHTSSRHAVHGSLTQHLLRYSPVPIWVVQNLHGQGESPTRAQRQGGIRIHGGTGR